MEKEVNYADFNVVKKKEYKVQNHQWHITVKCRK